MGPFGISQERNLLSLRCLVRKHWNGTLKEVYVSVSLAKQGQERAF